MEQRKASEVLLELELKIDNLISLIKNQDLNIKILSNKLNDLKEKLDKQPLSPPQIIVESDPNFNIYAEDSNRKIQISPENKLPLELQPDGFRRTSRPETYAGDDAYRNLAPKSKEGPKFPTQIPKSIPVKTDIIVPTNKLPEKNKEDIKQNSNSDGKNSIPIIQRVVDGNGKSAFLASVDIIDLSTMEQILKTKTNGTGKWMASLPVGNYRVIIKKTESITKEKIESTQDIQVDGTQSPLTLPIIIMKK